MPRKRLSADIVGHVRVKRGNATYFVSIAPEYARTATIEYLRECTAKCMSVGKCDVQLCMEDGGRFYEDKETLSELGIGHDSVVWGVGRRADGTWERMLGGEGA